MLVKDKIITKEEILNIVKQRENEWTISFEEMYIKGKNYISNLWKNV